MITKSIFTRLKMNNQFRRLIFIELWAVMNVWTSHLCNSNCAGLPSAKIIVSDIRSPSTILAR